MVIQAGIVNTTGGLSTLCAATIPIKPMATEPVNVAIISPKSICKRIKRRQCPIPPKSPATINTFLGVPKSIPQQDPTTKAIAKETTTSKVTTEKNIVEAPAKKEAVKKEPVKKAPAKKTAAKKAPAKRATAA